MPVPKPWYLALLFETIKTILIVSVSIVVGVVGVVIAHYTGLEH
jgi:hypothetical protein